MLLSLTDNDSRARNVKELTQLDHLRGLANDRAVKGEDLTEAEVKEYLEDLHVDLSDNAVACYTSGANSVFVSYILSRCAKETMRHLPVTLGAFKRVAGTIGFSCVARLCYSHPGVARTHVLR